MRPVFLVIRIFLFLASSSSVLCAQSLETLEVAVGEWGSHVSEEIDGYGEVPELVTVILERMGYAPQYIFMPWGQAESLVASNDQNEGPRATFPYIDTEARRQQFIFSEKAVFSSCMRFFQNDEKMGESPIQPLLSLNELSGYSMGYVSVEGGYQYSPELMEILEEPGNTESISLYDAFQELVDPASPVQIVPAEEDVGEALLYELFPEDRWRVVMIEEEPASSSVDCIVSLEYFFIASKRNPNNAEFMQSFDEVHEQIEEDAKESIARIRRNARDRPTPKNPMVVLDTGDSIETIIARSPNGQRIAMPRGSQGLLLEWRQTEDDLSPEGRVRVVTGPYRGQTVLVAGKYIRLK